MEAHIRKLDLDSVNSCLPPNLSRPLLWQLIRPSKVVSSNNKQVLSDIACNSISTSLHFNSKYVVEEAPTT
jgi:hypothetical protein